MYAVGYNQYHRLTVAEVRPEADKTEMGEEGPQTFCYYVGHVAGEEWEYNEDGEGCWVPVNSLFESREEALTAAAQEGVDEAKVMSDQAREFLDLRTALYPSPPAVKTKTPKTRYQRTPKL